VKRDRCGTTIPELLEMIESVRRPRRLVFEEGPLADWLYRQLGAAADEIVVSEPRRNRLIAAEGDKDDPIDAPKLAQLYRGGYLKAVHHPESLDRAVFKQIVGLYHDRVRHRVRQANRIMGQFRQHGVFIREKAFTDPAVRPALLKRWCPHPMLGAAMQSLWDGYDAAVAQENRLRRMLVQCSRREEVVRRFLALPGVGWIRAATFFVCVDTPWRFRGKSALWKYLGIGLERRHSGSGPTRLRVSRAVNRMLKSTMLGAAKSAIMQGDNPFAGQHERWIHAGRTPRIARRNVARSQSAVMWGMWKNGGVYRPEQVGAGAAV
jgi:transposase